MHSAFLLHPGNQPDEGYIMPQKDYKGSGNPPDRRSESYKRLIAKCGRKETRNTGTHTCAPVPYHLEGRTSAPQGKDMESSLIILTGRSEPTSRLGQSVSSFVSTNPHLAITRPEAGLSGK